jgi:hypothetical protein
VFYSNLFHFFFEEKGASFFVAAEYCFNHWMAVSCCGFIQNCLIFAMKRKALAYYCSIDGWQ